MKKTWTDIFDKATANELDLLLDKKWKTEPLDDDALQRIEADALQKTQLFKSTVQKASLYKRHRKAVLAVAACLILLVAACFGTYAYAVEAKEYNAAIRFFNDYNLSTEGLSRSEIKAIYRDITTATFAYSKTAEVIARSVSSEQIAGFELPQNNPTPEDVESLWLYKNYNGRYWVANADEVKARYECREDYRYDGNLGFDVFDKSHFAKYIGDELVWSVSFTEFFVSHGNYTDVTDGVIVFGNTPSFSKSQLEYTWLSKIDNNGNILWKCRLGNGFDYEWIKAVVENSDGSYAVFSDIQFDYFCLRQVDHDGNVISTKQIDMGRYSISRATRLGDGYVVQLNNLDTSEEKIVKMDRDGNITDAFSYEEADRYYFITDMIEFDGRIYLSAYSVPKSEDNAGGRYDIAPVVNYLFDNKIMEISSEELTPMVQENFTAMLLVCDSAVGKPLKFYSVKGALGGTLELDEIGNLLWDVESIVTAQYTPFKSFSTINGLCHVYQYVFDNRGVLKQQEKTGEVSVLYR